MRRRGAEGQGRKKTRGHGDAGTKRAPGAGELQEQEKAEGQGRKKARGHGDAGTKRAPGAGERN
ncbi:MAG: hypothetical protein BRC44_05400 [Cyanobacteria bacterium QS_4_48_99]|nr:MAG: hypothetical protein BRC44_05400 [Cyanobacteria bacterium QS_4_48_99]PSO92024.1 MAG: hypothetical protein BRC43_00025 [Cyanobacteria bacterium QS_3_48_167]PSO95745.1 MAG: hypothetical protein BRC46_02285 [Cyanobacteria bacterium QS_6_48_18]